MPNGVFEHIIDMLPMPRVWQWSMVIVVVIVVGILKIT